MNVKIAGNDLFKQSGWSGESSFNGLVSTGSGSWDSRKVSLSVSYKLGSQSVKAARNRTTGMEDEEKRVESQ